VDQPDDVTALFVYGSLLEPARRQEIIGRQVETIPATLPGYELRRGRYFYIRKRPAISISGLLLLNLTPQDFEELDRYEELPRLYTREIVGAFDHGGNPLRCWVYLPTAFTDVGSK
jgi:gamma-glutamylcyclotransferase (GGCT)/AIG2-like uncharacterized protein YtfP